MKMFQRLGLLVLVALFLAACSSGTGGPGTGPDNGPPTESGGVSASIVASATSVFFDEEVTLEIELAGADLADAEVSWTADGGSLSASTGAKTIWTAPREEAAFAVTATVVVDGKTLTETADIRVSPDPTVNYLVLQASHSQTKVAADGTITTTFGLEVDLAAQIIGPDAANSHFEWDLVAGGGAFTGFTNEPIVTWKAPEQLAQARIRATALAGGETLVEEIAIDVIVPVEIVEVLPEDLIIGRGNNLHLEVVLDGYYKEEAGIEWLTPSFTNTTPPPTPLFTIPSVLGDGKRAGTYPAPTWEGVATIVINPLLNGNPMPHTNGKTFEITVGLCDAGDYEDAINPCQIQNIHQLQAISETLERIRGHYVMTDDIDGSETANWNQGDGFNPIFRSIGLGFSGTFDGGSHAISGITINRSAPGEQYTGLFGLVNHGVIQNLVLSDFTVEGRELVGLLAGSSRSATLENIEVRDSSVHGRVLVGGLVGLVLPPGDPSHPVGEIKDIAIRNVDAILSGGTYNFAGIYGGLGGVAGGLSGGTVKNASVQDGSNLTGSSDNVGGIAGFVGPEASITQSAVAHSKISTITHPNVPRTSTNIGGIVGWNSGNVNTVEVGTTEVYASGEHIGGVVGFNDADGAIADAQISESEVFRAGIYNDAIGGFAGRNAGTIEGALVEDVTVRSVYGAGGFVGANQSGGLITRAVVTDSVVRLDGSLNIATIPEDRKFVAGFGATNFGEVALSNVQDTQVLGAHTDAAGFIVYNDTAGNIHESFVYMPNHSVRTTAGQVGGFVADNWGTLDHVYVILSEVAGNGQYIGGLVGTHFSGAWIKQSYAYTDVRRVDGDPSLNYVGPLVGRNIDLENGVAQGRVQTSFWSPDVARSAPIATGGGISITAAEFLVESTFANRTHFAWKFDGPDAKWVMPNTSQPGPHTPDLINNSRYE